MATRLVLMNLGNTLVITAPSADFWTQVLLELKIPVARDRLEAAIRQADLLFVPKYYDYLGRMAEFWAWYDGIVLNRLGISDQASRIRAGIQRGFEEGR